MRADQAESARLVAASGFESSRPDHRMAPRASGLRARTEPPPMTDARSASRLSRGRRPVPRALLGLVGVVGMGLGPPLSIADDADLEFGNSRLHVKAHPDLTVQTPGNEDCRFVENGTLESSTVEVSLWVYSK